jgi:hypothetical protein
MRLRVLRPSRRAARGQTLVLGALSFLILALMVVLSFNLSHALRKKISLQQHSDVLAYSMAVMEARALNYYAVSNRSIAASYVAMNSLHAYMAAASVTGQMMRAASENFEKIAIIEFGLCAAKRDPKHCREGSQAVRISQKYSRAGRDYDNKVRGLEGNFNTLQRGLDQLVDNLHASQAQVHQRTRESLRDGQAHGLSQLTRVNAPGASALPEEVGKLNTNEFDCAVDGKPCSGSVANSAPKARARVMTEVANASRPSWPANRGLSGSFPSHLHSRFLQELRNIPGEGSHYPVRHVGTAKTAQSSGEVHGSGQASGNEGLVIAADEEGRMFNKWKHGLWESKYKSEVWSSQTGGGHTSRFAHSGQHRFEGVNARDLDTCTRSGNCFMKFRANDDPQRDWGQPRVYSYLTRSLRGDDKGKPLPWELNRSATVTFRQGATTGKLTLAAGEGAALSKALVYYHRLGDKDGWREAPNLFAPYWRAKLHPFTPQQAVQVLEAAQDKDAARLVQSSPGLSL